MRSSSGRMCRQPAEAWPVKLARAPWPATSPLEVGDEVGQPLRRHGRVLDERRRAFGARRAHEKRQDGAAQGRRLGEIVRLLEPDLCAAPSSPASARRRARPARASSSLPWYSTVSMAASSPASRAAMRRKVAMLGARRSGARSRNSTADGPVSRMATLASSAARSVENVNAAPTRRAGRGSSSTSSSVNSASEPSEPASSRPRLGSGASSSRRL